MTTNDELEKMAVEYLKLPDLMTGEMFSPPAYKDAFKAGHKSRDVDVAKRDKEIRALHIELASQAAKAQKLVEALKRIEFPYMTNTNAAFELINRIQIASEALKSWRTP